VGDNTCGKEDVCFPQEFVFDVDDMKGECKKCNKKVDGHEHVCIMDKYVVKIENINPKVYVKGHVEEYKYRDETVKTKPFHFDYVYEIEKRMENISSAAKLLHYSRHERELKSHSGKTYQGIRNTFVYENLVAKDYIELANHPIARELNIWKFCGEKTDRLISLMVQEMPLLEVLKAGKLEKRFAHLVDNYKTVFNKWYEHNKTFLKALFRAIKQIIDCGVYHRDVFEENIFIKDSPLQIKFIDFEYAEIIEKGFLTQYSAFKHFIKEPLNSDYGYSERFLDHIWRVDLSKELKEKFGDDNGQNPFSFNPRNVIAKWLNSKDGLKTKISKKDFRRVVFILCKLREIYSYYIDFLCKKYTFRSIGGGQEPTSGRL